MANSFFWRVGAVNFDSASSWDTFAPDTDDTSGFGIATRAPGAADYTEVDVAATISGPGTANQLNINAAVSISGTTTVGTYTIIGDAAFGSATVTSLWRNTSFLAVGNHAAGALFINGGTVQNDADIGVGQFAPGTLVIDSGGTLTTSGTLDTIGNTVGSSGTVAVNGSGSVWQSGGAIDVGVSATGTLDVNAGTVVAATGLTVGQNSGSNGTLIVENGGTVTNDGSLTIVGDDVGSIGTVTVTGTGSVLDGPAAFIVGLGTATVSDGGVLNTTSLAVGQLSQSVGSMTIGSGGTVIDSGLANIGNTAGSEGTLTILAGGTLSMTAAAQTTRNYFRIGLNGPSGGLPGAQGTVVVDGAGALLDAGANPISIGSGTGTLTIENGGVVKASSSDSSQLASLSFANNQSASATVTVTGTGSELLAKGYALIGRGGTAEMTIADGGTVQVSDAALDGSGMGIGAGRSAGPTSATVLGGSGTVSVTSNGLLEINSTDSGMTVGGDGSTGMLTVNDGGVVKTGLGITVGTATEANGTIYGGSGTLDIDAGGTVEVSIPAQAVNYSFSVGNANASVGGPTTEASGTVTVTGAKALLDTNGNALAIGLLSQGAMTVSQGGSVVSGTPDGTKISALSLGRLGTGSLTVTDAGSQFTVNGGIYVGRGGTGALTIENGASMSVLADSLGATYVDIGNAGLTNGNTLISGGSGSALVTSGGHLFSQGGMFVGLDGNSGTLTVDGGGKVEVSTGLLIGNTLTVAAGGSDITTAGTTPITTATPFAASGTIAIGAGGTLQVDGTGISGSPDITVGAGAGSTGTLTVDGAGALVNASGGEILVDGPGPASGMLDVSNGGTVVAGSMGVGASGSISLNGGAIDLASMTLSAGAHVSGNGMITGDVTNAATMEALAQGLTVAGTISGTGLLQIGAGSTLSALSVFGTSAISFLGGGSRFITAQTGTVDAIISGLVQGDTIALQSLLFESGATASIDSGVLTVTSGTASETLAANGIADATRFLVTKDTTSNGTDIAVLCFCGGTEIATPSGSRPVETLQPGDLVLTHSRQARPVQWIGVGKVRTTRGQRTAATPIIVRKGALAANVPDRDLHITKGHALFLDGVLIPVEFLVNHRTIIWDDHAQEVSLYHVELETHDVLVANGAPAESYRDDGNRWLFQNANAGWNLPPLEPCARLLTGGAEVDAVWRRLLERSGPRPGVALTDDPDLHLVVDGERIPPTLRHEASRIFRLRRRPAAVRIVSRVGVPQELGVARDPRPLGVALQRIAVRQGTRFRVMTADDPTLTEGFHAFELDGGLRWTDGDAVPPMNLFHGFEGPMELVLHVAATTRYPLFEEAEQIRAA